MSTDTDDLRDIFLDVSDETTLTERQRETPSHDPIAEPDAAVEREVSAFAGEDGLTDTIDGPGEGGEFDGASV